MATKHEQMTPDEYAFHCEQELAPAREYSGRTPEQRAADARRLTDAEIWASHTPQRIAKLEARIAELGEMFEELAQGGRNEARRVDGLESKLSNALDIINGGFAALNTFYDRVVTAVPSIGRRTITEQCEGSWMPEEGRAYHITPKGQALLNAMREEENAISEDREYEGPSSRRRMGAASKGEDR